jgi:hypothetical protein
LARRRVPFVGAGLVRKGDRISASVSRDGDKWSFDDFSLKAGELLRQKRD